MTDSKLEDLIGKTRYKIHEVRGMKVMLDRDLAVLYGVPTFRFNEAIKRNRMRFPQDFAFQVDCEEFARLISQNAISNAGRGGVRKLPWVFTEHGAIMAANVLNSPRAIQRWAFSWSALLSDCGKKRGFIVFSPIG